MSGLPEHSMSDRHLDVIGFDEAETFPGLFQQRVARATTVESLMHQARKFGMVVQSGPKPSE